jgi:nucleotide-binding universal stress UspA family protein
MNEDQSPVTIRRILVAIDASSNSMTAVESAAGLAARWGAELLGLFVEDSELFEMASSPYARRILYPSAEQAPVDRAAVESELKAQSEHARKALASAAEQSRVPWSFRIVRGNVATEVLAAADEADLLAMGRTGWPFGKQGRIGSTVLEIIAATSPVLLLSEERLPEHARLVVCYDGSGAARCRLIAAARLARTGIGGLTVFLSAKDEQTTDEMKREVAALLAAGDIEIRYRQIDPLDEASLLTALREEKPGMLVLGERELLGSKQAALLQAGVPLLLLDGELDETE